jgi:hypothetical protein
MAAQASCHMGHHEARGDETMFIYVTRTGTQGQRFNGYIGRTVPNPRRLVDDIEYVCEAPDNDTGGRALAMRMNREADAARRWLYEKPLPVMARERMGVAT